MDYKNLKVQKQRYRYLAYITVRDALAFYLGIPKFLDEQNIKNVLHKTFNEKVAFTKKKEKRELTLKEKNRCLNTAKRLLIARIEELQCDLEHCQQILFEDNIWLQLLDLNPDFFENYLSKLNNKTKDSLAVVPKLQTRDHSLGRPYINDNFNMSF